MIYSAKRRAQNDRASRARQAKKRKIDPSDGEGMMTEPTDGIAAVAQCTVSLPVHQINTHPRTNLVEDVADSPPGPIRFVFDTRSAQAWAPSEHAPPARSDVGVLAHSLNDVLPSPQLDLNKIVPEPLVEGSDSYPRLPPSRDDAQIALQRLKALLHPPRITGRGYKRCKLDEITRARYQSIVTCLHFFLRSSPSFIDSSVDAAIGVGRGVWHARKIREWVQRFIATGELPSNNYGQANRSILDDEDIANDIRLNLRTKGKYITAEDVTRFVNRSDVQQKHGLTTSVTRRTAQRWLHKIGYRWGREKKGQYYDGHEREDVVQYRQEVFVPQWKALELFMASWDDKTGLELPLNLQPNQREATVWCHDATTAYAHDRQDIRWVHIDELATLSKKGQGASVMFADYISPRHGFLRSRDGKCNARKILCAGKGRDGYMTNDDICEQFRTAVELVKQEYPDEDHIFVYDNARIHKKRPTAAPSARNMTKFESDFQVVAKDRDGKKYKIKMNNPCFPDGLEQQLYLPNGKFRGMVALLRERGYATEGLKAECRSGFKCDDINADCCCRRILFKLIDMQGGQKSVLEMLAEELGVRVLFLPKYHCELNPIEQCWGYAKRLYRMAPPSSLTADMEKNMLRALESIPITSIRRFVARSRRFIDAYAEGLDGPNAAASDWVQKRFQSHRVTPEHLDV